MMAFNGEAARFELVNIMLFNYMLDWTIVDTPASTSFHGKDVILRFIASCTYRRSIWPMLRKSAYFPVLTAATSSWTTFPAVIACRSL